MLSSYSLLSLQNAHFRRHTPDTMGSVCHFGKNVATRADTIKLSGEAVPELSTCCPHTDGQLSHARHKIVPSMSQSRHGVVIKLSR